MKRSTNDIIGVGSWVEDTKGNFLRLDHRDPWSWFRFPILTLREMLSAA